MLDILCWLLILIMALSAVYMAVNCNKESTTSKKLLLVSIATILSGLMILGIFLSMKDQSFRSLNFDYLGFNAHEKKL